jgi:predicted RNA binding protein YcfA (HicA-like mRNA interferase family)
MGNLKCYSGKELLVILESIGFEVIRIKGSHHYLKHPDGRATVVPVHSNESIGIGLFMKILNDIEIKKVEFIQKFQ